MKKILRILGAMLSLPFIPQSAKADDSQKGSDVNIFYSELSTPVKSNKFEPGPITTCRRTCIHSLDENGVSIELRDPVDFRTGDYNPYGDGSI